MSDPLADEFDDIDQKKSCQRQCYGLPQVGIGLTDRLEMSRCNVLFHQRVNGTLGIRISFHDLFSGPDFIERSDHETHEQGDRQVVMLAQQPRKQVRKTDDAGDGSDCEKQQDTQPEFADSL